MDLTARSLPSSSSEESPRPLPLFYFPRAVKSVRWQFLTSPYLALCGSLGA